MIQPDLEQIGQAQRDRLFFIDFRALFFGEVRRNEIMGRFGIAEAAASRDLALYRTFVPDNLTFDHSRKIYRSAPGFEALFSHDPEHSLHALSEGIGDDTSLGSTPQLRVERPMRPASPKIGVVAALSRAIHMQHQVQVQYVSQSSRRKKRIIAPHALVDTGLRWHVRAWDVLRQRFADFVTTRIETAEEAGPAEANADREYDEQWMRIVPLELVPHPALHHQTAVAVDYGMTEGVLHLRLRAPLVGYVMQAWGVDTSLDHCEDPLRHQLWLRNTGTLFGVESMEFALGYHSVRPLPR